MQAFSLMDNIMVYDHEDPFIYKNTKYLGWYCDVTILWHFNINCNDPNEWLFQAFAHIDDCFKDFLRDSSYVGQKIFITWQIHHQCNCFLMLTLP
jgi:hypothetical protein